MKIIVMVVAISVSVCAKEAQGLGLVSTNGLERLALEHERR